MKKKLLVIAFLLLASLSSIRSAEPLNYIWRGKDVYTDKLSTQQRVTENYLELTENMMNDTWLGIGSDYGEQRMFCVLKHSMDIETLNVQGLAYLVLCDGATLTCTGGVKVEDKDQLYIFSQSDGDNQGKLVVTNSHADAAGIGGGGNDKGLGKLVICGGDISVMMDDRYGAAIGGGKNGSISDSFTMYGGKIFATTVQDGQETYGAAIGGGWEGWQIGEINIYGGEISVMADYGAGIGGGYKKGCSKINIYGGTINTACTHGAGIGNGSKYTINESKTDDLLFLNGYPMNEMVAIYGGTVNAKSFTGGAGIGGGVSGHSPYVKITGGKVDVHTYGGGAAIGGGRFANQGHYIYITGGNVIAENHEGAPYELNGNTIWERAWDATKQFFVDEEGSNKYAAGIGGGYRGNGGWVRIEGGKVRAAGGGARSFNGGAGIGGGSETFMNPLYQDGGEGGNVVITGGTVDAVAGYGAVPIGHGYGDSENMGLIIGDGLSVQYSEKEDNYLRYAYTIEGRIAYCQTDGYKYAKIKPCSHECELIAASEWTFTKCDDKHEMLTHHYERCTFCNLEMKSKHWDRNRKHHAVPWDKDVCPCGWPADRDTELFKEVTFYTAHFDEEKQDYVYSVNHKEYYVDGDDVKMSLPNDTDDNLWFAYWTSTTNTSNCFVNSNVTDYVIRATSTITDINRNMDLYARYYKSTITVSDALWATIISPCDATLPEGLTGYAVREIDYANNKVILCDVTNCGGLKAGEPYMLHATSAGTYTLTQASSTITKPDVNLLEVSDVETGNGVYVLANKGNGAGFYKWVGGLLGAGRVYLRKTNGGTAVTPTFISLDFDNDYATGIDTFITAEANNRNDNAIYNLQGIRMNNSTLPKGIYVVNGKKTVMK